MVHLQDNKGCQDILFREPLLFDSLVGKCTGQTEESQQDSVFDHPESAKKESYTWIPYNTNQYSRSFPDNLHHFHHGNRTHHQSESFSLESQCVEARNKIALRHFQLFYTFLQPLQLLQNLYNCYSSKMIVPHLFVVIVVSNIFSWNKKFHQNGHIELRRK